VQPLCAEILALKNEQLPAVRRAGSVALPAAQEEGAVDSRDAMARHFPAELDRTLDLLTRRELIEPADGGYCFQMELIRRWFAQR